MAARNHLLNNQTHAIICIIIFVSEIKKSHIDNYKTRNARNLIKGLMLIWDKMFVSTDA